MKKLEEIAEVRALTPNYELKKDDILVSQAGKKIVKLAAEDISKYQDKKTFLVVSAPSEYVDVIYNSLTSKDFETWFSATAKGTAMKLIHVVDLKEFEIII